MPNSNQNFPKSEMPQQNTNDYMQINPTAPTKGQFSKYHHDLTNAVHHQQNNTWPGYAGNLAYRAGLSCMAGACRVGEGMSPVKGKTLAEGTGKLAGGVAGTVGGVFGLVMWLPSIIHDHVNPENAWNLNPRNVASSRYHKVHDSIVDSVDHGLRSGKYQDARANRTTSDQQMGTALELLTTRGLQNIPQDKLERLIAIDDDRGAKDGGSLLRRQLDKMRLIAGDRGNGNGNDERPQLGIIELNGTASNPENSVLKGQLDDTGLREEANDAVEILQENTDKLHALHREVQDFNLNEAENGSTIQQYCRKVTTNLTNKIAAKKEDIEGIHNELGEGQEGLKEAFIVALEEDIQKLKEEKEKITDIHTNLTKNKPLSTDDKSALIDAYTAMKKEQSDKLCNDQKRFLAELKEQTQKLEKYRGILELNNPLLEDLTRSSDTIMNAAAERANGNSIESGTGCTATSKDGTTEILKVKIEITNSAGNKEQKEVALELTNQEFEKLAEQWNNLPANKDRQVTVSRRWFSGKLYIQFPKDDKGTQLMNDYKSHMTGKAGQEIMARKHNASTDLGSNESLGNDGAAKVSMAVEKKEGDSGSQQSGNKGQPPSMSVEESNSSTPPPAKEIELTNTTKVERDDADETDETGISMGRMNRT